MRQVWHVYYATRGAPGAYVDALLRASERAHIPAYAFVSCAFAYSTPRTVRWFFPITDRIKSRGGRWTWLRGVELVLGYAFLLLVAAVRRPTLNLHLVGPLAPTYFFYWACKLVRLRVWVTCHDVTPHSGAMTSRRLNIFRHADRLVVHNESARRKLLALLGAAAPAIALYPFPFSSHEEIFHQDRFDAARAALARLLGQDLGRYYLLAGVVRASKGIAVLSEAWRLAECRRHHKLVIAGRWSGVPEEVRRQVEQLDNCLILDRFLEDEELVCLLQHARFSLLPYNEYTHSGILLTVARHGGAVIVSDIDMFTELLPNYALMFPRGDARRLADVLDRSARLTEDEIRLYRNQLKDAVDRQDRQLVEAIGEAYAEFR